MLPMNKTVVYDEMGLKLNSMLKLLLEAFLCYILFQCATKSVFLKILWYILRIFTS